MTDMCFDINCSCSINTIGILVSIAFVCVSFGLLISGAICTKSGNWISNPKDCESVYVSGLILSFMIGTVLMFCFLFWFVEKIDPPTASASAPVVVVNPHKKKKMPLHSVLV
jgi:hypothetical protein